MIGVSCTQFCSKGFNEVWEEVSREFNHWEIFSELNHAIQKVYAPFIGKMNEYDMTYSLHSAISDTNAAATNERMREASFMEFYSEIETAAAMGIDIITIHPGTICLSVKGVNERSIDCARLTMKSLDKVSKEYGVTVAIENMPNVPILLGRTAEELNRIIEGTDLSVCFDIGHANTMGQIEDMVDMFRSRIVNVHIHDNMGNMDSHLTLGEGNIDFTKVISKLRGYSKEYIIESLSLESAVESKKVLQGLLG